MATLKKAAGKTVAKTATSKAVAKPAKAKAAASKIAKSPVVKVKSAAKSAAKVAAKKAPRQKAAVSSEQRYHYVETAAYYIAERRGFAPGDTAADWLAAEAEIDRLIASGKLG